MACEVSAGVACFFSEGSEGGRVLATTQLHLRVRFHADDDDRGAGGAPPRGNSRPARIRGEKSRRLGQFLPDFGGTELLDEINWAAPKIAACPPRKWRTRSMPACANASGLSLAVGCRVFLATRSTFSTLDVVDGIEPLPSVNRLFNQETSRAEVVCCAATSENVITVVWRNSGGINIGPGVSIKPYIVTTTLKTDPSDGGLICFQEDEFAIPGWDILISALLPQLRSLPFLAPEAPPVEVLATI